MLKYTLIKQIDDSNLTKVVQKEYGKPYCFQQQDGCQPRGTRHMSGSGFTYDCEEFNSITEAIKEDAYGVSFEDWLAADPNDPIFGEEVWEREMTFQRNVYPRLEYLINDIHAKGLIEAGEYQILIDW
jgi:hypothetical protein